MKENQESNVDELIKMFGTVRCLVLVWRYAWISSPSLRSSSLYNAQPDMATNAEGIGILQNSLLNVAELLLQ